MIGDASLSLSCGQDPALQNRFFCNFTPFLDRNITEAGGKGPGDEAKKDRRSKSAVAVHKLFQLIHLPVGVRAVLLGKAHIFIKLLRARNPDCAGGHGE